MPQQSFEKHKEKKSQLTNLLGEFSSAAIAFSAGVDSTFLAAMAREVLPEKLLLITVSSALFPAEELESSIKLAADLDLPQMIIELDVLNIEGFSKNTSERCYFCKKQLFTEILKAAGKNGFKTVLEGTNSDDLQDYRPGRKALFELGICSPLAEVGLSKKEIRFLSIDMKLETSDKPSMACLASRIAYGEEITVEKLRKIEESERKLRILGLKQCRVRCHGDIARIEVAGEEMEYAWRCRSELLQICKEAGFIYVSLDLHGYRTGAMNEIL